MGPECARLSPGPSGRRLEMGLEPVQAVQVLGEGWEQGLEAGEVGVGERLADGTVEDHRPQTFLSASDR